MTHIFIADDHAEIHAGVDLLFERSADCKIIGHATNGTVALKRIGELRPDVVILDVKMPGLNGIEVAKRLHDQDFNGKIIILTQYDEEEYVRGAIEAGASGYLLKDQMQEAVTAVRAVVNGKQYFSPGLVGSLIADRLSKPPEEETPNGTPKLTPRERDFVRLLLEGHTVDQIGRKLSLSAKTMAFYSANIKQKFGIKEFSDLRTTSFGKVGS